MLSIASSADAQVSYQTLNDPSGETELTGVSGQNIVGQAPEGDSFLYNGSTFTTISDPNATDGTFVRGVSGSTVVGTYYGPSGYSAFTETNGVYDTLSYPGAADTSGSGISGTTIVGSYLSGGNEYGFIDTNGNFTTLSVPVTTLSSNNQYVTDISGISGNTVVGSYTYNGESNGFAYQNGMFTTIDDPLGTGGTVITGISGDNIVGYYFGTLGTDGFNQIHGFLYDGSSFQTLDDPLASNFGLDGTSPTGISGNTIVGSYFSNGFGTDNGFIATIPEPNSLSLVIFGISGIARIQLRKRLCRPAERL